MQLRAVAPFTGAWIEINNQGFHPLHLNVAPFTGTWIKHWLTDLLSVAPSQNVFFHEATVINKELTSPFGWKVICQF